MCCVCALCTYVYTYMQLHTHVWCAYMQYVYVCIYLCEVGNYSQLQLFRSEYDTSDGFCLWSQFGTHLEVGVVSEPGLDAALRKPLPGHLAMSGAAALPSEHLCCSHHSWETRSACVPIFWWPLAPGLQCPPGAPRSRGTLRCFSPAASDEM